MSLPPQLSRRHALLGFAAGASLIAKPAAAALPRDLAFLNLHTGETLRTVYWADGAYVQQSLGDIAKVLRDHRTGDIKPIDPALLDLLHTLRGHLGVTREFQIISGYRSPATNNRLHEASDGVATHSLHMEGKAADIRVQGVALDDLRRAARELKAGGTGYYPQSDFVHVDVGRVRFW